MRRQTKALVEQTEKRIKAEMIQLLSDARKSIVLDILKDLEIREAVKNEIKRLDSK